MEFLGKVFETVKNTAEIVKNVKDWYGYHSGLEESMQNLKRKMEDLSAQENDVNKKISSEEHRVRKKRKAEVVVWLRDEQEMKNDVQRLEQEVVGERNLISRVQLGKRIIEKIQEVEKLQEKGRAFDSLLVDDFSGLLMPPTKDFVESTEARNLDRVWECLMNEDVRQIGVYGMGGVGKTTIMKQINNRILKETGKFDIVYWVTVSQAFNISKLQSSIAEVLNLSLSNDEDETIRASELYEALSQKKKYLLILDDLWEAIPLERVGIPEPTQFNGCKIVLTTRSLDVCRRMDCRAIKVELLTEQEALTLFLKKAVRNEVELAPDVKPIAAKIAKKCARLPLAIVTVAGSLRRLEGIHEWRDALNEFTNLMNDEVSGGGREVFEQLKFSYSRLGDKVVQDCFLYCSLYPEDCDILEEDLIEIWIAEGLVREMNSVEAMEDKGRSILEKLKSTCLLESTNLKGLEWVRMHDLIRDMAIRIKGARYRYVKEDEEGLWSEDHEKISSVINFMKKLPNRPPVCPRLTSLLLRYNDFSLIPDSYFTNMPCLKVLDLSNTKIQSLPESISNLENLHALLMTRCQQLEYVPSLEKLKALKMFVLTSSLIKEAPNGLEQLVNLRKLKLSRNRRLETFPSTKLRGLSKLQLLEIDGTRVEVSIEDLMCLSQLKVVCVQFHSVQELTRYMISQQFQGLEYYRLGVGEILEMHMYCVAKTVVIDFESKHFRGGVDQLVLPKDVDIFVLRGSHGLISLSSMASLFFEVPTVSPAQSISFNLTKLSIAKCHGMKYILPAQLLQNLPNLETLEVNSCESVEEIIVGEKEMSDSQHRDNSNAISFPRLKRLILDFLPTLKSIYAGTLVSESEFSIYVKDCPMLRRLPLSLHMDNEQASAPPYLKRIQGGQEWWESLEWDDPRTKTTLQPFFWDGIEHEFDSDLSSVSSAPPLPMELSDEFDNDVSPVSSAPPLPMELSDEFDNGLSSVSSDYIDFNKLPKESVSSAPPLLMELLDEFDNDLSSDSIDLNKWPKEFDDDLSSQSSDCIDLTLRI